jgi:hypothetical protein
MAKRRLKARRMTKKTEAVKPSTEEGPVIKLPLLSDLKPKFKAFGGSNSDTWNKVNLDMLIRTFGSDSQDPEVLQRHFEYAYAGLGGIDPKDEIEGMMASQMVGLHVACLDVTAKGMSRQNEPAERRLYLATAAKLSRAMVGLVEALNRHRGKSGTQTVTVEHVHVHRHLHAHESKGGDFKKLEEQAHAKVIAHAPIAALLGADASGNALPVAQGEGPAKVQNARRRPRKRGTKGK